MMKKFVRSIVAFLCFAGLLAQHAAAAYPARPISVVVGFSAGGPADVVARTVAPALGTALGAAIVIENRPGADGTIAAAQVARAQADGYTLLLAPSTHAINASLYKKLPYDPIKGFASIALIGDSPNIIAVHPSVPARNLEEFVSYAKRGDSRLNYASTSSVTELATELLNRTAGIRMTKIPYKGAGQAMPALLSGEVHVMVSSMLTLMPQVSAGRVRPLAVTSLKRAEIAPNIPTVAEAGLPGYSASTWYGLFAPAGVPQDVVQRLADAMETVLKDKDVQARLAAQGLSMVPEVNSPATFGAYVQAEAQKWQSVVQAAGISAD
ncbi:MAG: tripartite tricarboxylate transporter substrate binding protein [Alicycliphilus denitrificans]|nr:tripartite tricarboxylate transporter substrate binding protein [Alicycliphilus denitrificans]